MPTVAELLASPSKEDLLAKLLAILNAAGFPVTDWLPGSAARTQMKMYADGLKDMSDLVAAITAGGYTSTAEDEWLTMLAKEIYALDRAAATYTVQKINVACSAGAGPVTFPTGAIAVARSTGNRYVYQGSPASIPDSSSSDLSFTAESPGALYADGAASIRDLVTPIPGITIVNQQLSFGGRDSSNRATAAATNLGTGTITPSGSPAQSRIYTITILASGNVTAGAMRISYIDSSANVTNVDVTPIPATSTAGGDSVTLTMASGSGGFVAGDSYTFNTPGSPIIQQGVDAESNSSLAKRCQGRWPSLSQVPTSDKYIAWVEQCSIDNAFGVTKVSVVPSFTLPGVTNVLVATATGAPGGSTVTAIQSYINAREGLTDQALVRAANPRNITVGGAVKARSTTFATVQSQADINWAEYIGALAIGGDQPGGVVRLADLTRAIMDAGAVDVSGLTLNGSAANVTMATDDVAVVANTLTLGLTWESVA